MFERVGHGISEGVPGLILKIPMMKFEDRVEQWMSVGLWVSLGLASSIHRMLMRRPTNGCASRGLQPHLVDPSRCS